MSAELQNRSEHSRSLEDAEKYQAIDTLKDLGLLIPVSDVETFHGRVGYGEEEAWSVDPTFANGSNDSGNYNVNKRPTLYSGDSQTAQDFADERSGLRQAYYSSLFDMVKAYTPEENEGRLERQNAHMRKLWEEDVASGHKDPTKSQPDVWTMEQLLDNNSHVEAKYLMKELGDEEFDKFKQKYASERRAEIHEIVTADSDAVVLNSGFNDTKLDCTDTERYNKALRSILIPITEGSPVDFEDRNAVQPLIDAVEKAKKETFLREDITEIALAAGVDEEVATQIIGAYNAQRFAAMRPSYLVNKLISSADDIVFDGFDQDGERKEFPINLEYVQRYLRENHIVGISQEISSVTLGRDITSVSFFDLEKVTTQRDLEARCREVWSNLGGLASDLKIEVPIEKEDEKSLKLLLEDVHAKPDKLVEAAKKVPGYKDIYDADAGLWEGFTLAEHTETVLRNFDENFAEQIPVELIAPMRLAILAHDLGKPEPARNGDTRNQKQYNAKRAEEFMAQLEVDLGLADLLVALIGEGQDLASMINVRKAGEPAEKALRSFAERELKKFYKTDDAGEDKIVALSEMAKMLQVCDGGAYTSIAITRREGGNGRHCNAPSFNSDFAQPAGFGKRTLRLREEGDDPAAPDLTPKGQKKNLQE